MTAKVLMKTRGCISLSIREDVQPGTKQRAKGDPPPPPPPRKAGLPGSWALG